jgi:26S proteasome regulatory subunit N10
LLSRPEVLVTPTQDVGKVLSALHLLKIAGEADMATGIQIALLALKHRQNKNQRQRIIVFVGSPLALDEKSLVKLGKKLKKNNVAIDVISFGEGEDNDTSLRAFVDSVSSSDNRFAIRSADVRLTKSHVFPATSSQLNLAHIYSPT